MLGLATREQLQECLGVLGAMLWLPRQGEFPLDMAQQLGIVSQLLGPEITKGKTNLLLSEVREQQLGGFSRVTKLHGFRANRGKNANFATKLWYPGSHSGCVPVK